MLRAALAASTIVFVGCFHDFDAFDPVAGSSDGGGADGTAQNPVNDASSSGSDANDGAPVVDGAPQQTFDAPSGCGADCRQIATSCAGVCADDEFSCEAPPCDGGTCKVECENKDDTCVSNCVTTCETCTSSEGCIDQAGCAAAAP